MFKKILLMLKNKLSGSAIGTTPVPRRVVCLTAYVSDSFPIIGLVMNSIDYQVFVTHENLSTNYISNEYSTDNYITNTISIEVNDGC